MEFGRSEKERQFFVENIRKNSRKSLNLKIIAAIGIPRLRLGMTILEAA